MFTILHNDINRPHDILMTQCQFLILVQDFRIVSFRKLLGDMSPWCVHHNFFFISSYFIILDSVLVCDYTVCYTVALL